MSDPRVADRGLRFLGYSRAALGLLLVVRTTPLSNRLPEPMMHMATPLLGWPEHGFRAAWGGLEIPDALVMALCVVRTVAAVLFALGIRARLAGIVAAAAAFVVMSQDAFAFKFTLYTLFVGTFLLAVSGAGQRFAVRPSPAGTGSSPWLVRAFVVSLYAWSAIAKLRASWLSGETLRVLYGNGFLRGPLADVLFATAGRCQAAAWSVVVTELALGPLLLIRRTRMYGLALAVAMHAAYEWTARPDVFGWVMLALLLSFVGDAGEVWGNFAGTRLQSAAMKARVLAIVAVSIPVLFGCAPDNSGASAPAAAPAPAAPQAAAPAAPTAAANPVPPRVKGQNPFANVHFYINQYNPASQQARAWEATRPADAKLLEKIGSQPVGRWVGEWSGDAETAAHALGAGTNQDGTIPVVILYNIPNRDCGQYSKGGSTSNEAYRAWIRQFAKGANGYRLIVILEPDALGLLTKCLSPADQQARLATLKDAVDVLEATPGISVYIDAGNAKWAPPDDMAKRLLGAGIANADGFALNVSNYIANEPTLAYGHAISSATGGKHFIIDTARNGNGATNDAQWCNPEGRALGNAPTTNTGDPLVDAFFWLKPPGESDGTCNGGPKAGDFWPEQALGLAKRAKW